MKLLQKPKPSNSSSFILAYSESKLTFHFVVVVLLVVLVLRRKVEKDGNAKKVPFTNATVFQLRIHIDHDTYYRC